MAKEKNVALEILCKGIEPKTILKGLPRERAEVKSVMGMIDETLSYTDSIPETDFKAGYIAGLIAQKAETGVITQSMAGKLRVMLDSKHELIRNLKEEPDTMQFVPLNVHKIMHATEMEKAMEGVRKAFGTNSDKKSIET